MSKINELLTQEMYLRKNRSLYVAEYHIGLEYERP